MPGCVLWSAAVLQLFVVVVVQQMKEFVVFRKEDSSI